MKLFSKVKVPAQPDYVKIAQLEDELGIVNELNYERKYDEMLIAEFERVYGEDCKEYFRVMRGRFGNRKSNESQKAARRAYGDLLEELNLDDSRRQMEKKYEYMPYIYG